MTHGPEPDYEIIDEEWITEYSYKTSRVPLWLRHLWVIRKRPWCWVRGHRHSERNRGGALLWASWCMRCYGDDTINRDPQRVWFSQ
jgi:hypothetical protein